MATNDFLVFGGGAGANVITQVTYSGLAARTAGFSAGVAQSAQLNKVWRQSSIMAAVVGQFVADITGQDVLDDGTTATLLANVKAAVSAQSVGVVGSMRNAKMSVASASASATFTADEIIVEDALGGKTYRLANFSQTINLATTGAGGMDTGSAPASGYVGLYAGHNPTTGARTLFARNATSTVLGSVYGGANAPAGITASALVSVVPTNASGLIVPLVQVDRRVSINPATALNTTTQQGSPTALSLSSIVPPNTKSVWGNGSLSGGTGAVQLIVLTTANIGGQQVLNSAFSASFNYLMCAFSELSLMNQQTIYWIGTVASGAVTISFIISGYTF